MKTLGRVIQLCMLESSSQSSVFSVQCLSPGEDGGPAEVRKEGMG